MKKSIFLISILVCSFSYAETQTVVCSGTANSGNSYRVSFSMNSEDAVYASDSGIRIFESQPIVLEHFNSEGVRTFHHVENVKRFFANPLTEGRSVYSYSGDGGQSITIDGFSEEPNQRLTLNVGRFRGISLRNSNCKIDGNFTEVSGFTINGRQFIDEESSNVESSSQAIEDNSQGIE